MAQILQDTRTMKRQLTMARNQGYRVVYIDETMFTRSTVPSSEYCLPKQNVTVDQDQLNEPTLALLSGVSKEKGQELFMVFPDSVNIPKFQEYLAKLREENGDDKICIFLDNLSSHRSNQSKDTMRELGFKYVFNVPYSPDYNPIEFVFAKVKHEFRTLRAQKLTGVIQDSHEALIAKAVKSVRKQDVVNSVNHVLKLL